MIFFIPLVKEEAAEASKYVLMVLKRRRMREYVCEERERKSGSAREKERKKESECKSGRISESGKNDFYALARESFLKIRLKIAV